MTSSATRSWQWARVASSPSPPCRRNEPRARRALAAGLVEVEACERALTRFSPSSDPLHASTAPGKWIKVDPRSSPHSAPPIDARRVTAGRFDPRSSRRSLQPATTGPSPS